MWMPPARSTPRIRSGPGARPKWPPRQPPAATSSSGSERGPGADARLAGPVQPADLPVNPWVSGRSRQRGVLRATPGVRGRAGLGRSGEPLAAAPAVVAGGERREAGSEFRLVGGVARTGAGTGVGSVTAVRQVGRGAGDRLPRSRNVLIPAVASIARVVVPPEVGAVRLHGARGRDPHRVPVETVV